MTDESDWRARLRERGYRLTPQRELILGAVEQLGHATPDEVLAEVRTHSTAKLATKTIGHHRSQQRRRKWTGSRSGWYQVRSVCN